ncbi:MAG: hypothetical protein H7840_08585 [Alphaproteobacteria bacterium]
MIGIALVVGTALAASILWVGAVWFYVYSRMGLDGVLALEPSALATLAATVGAPVAGIWLVAGFVGTMLALRGQGKVIRQLLWQAKRTAEHTEITTRSLLELREQAEHRAFFHTVELAFDDLNGLVATLAERAGLCSEEDLDMLWRRHRDGDRSVFCRLFREAAEQDTAAFARDLGGVVASDARFRSDLLFFLGRYDRLVRLGTEHDDHRYVLDLLEDGSFGVVQSLLARASRQLPDPSSFNRSDEPPPPTGKPRKKRTRNLFAAMSGGRREAPSPAPGEGGGAKAEPTVRGPEPKDAKKEPREGEGSGRPFSPLNPDFPKQDGWPPPEAGED